MEYLREEEHEKDEEKESLGRRVLSPQKSPDQESKSLGHWKLAKEKRSKVAYVSRLMVVGKVPFLENIDAVTFLSLREKVLPVAVLVAFVAYFGIAARFYFE